MRDVTAIVMAAGQGTRLKSSQPKVLHAAAGRSLIAHVLEALRPLGLGQILVVVGADQASVTAAVEACDVKGARTVMQPEALGTADAVRVALPAVHDDTKRLLVLPGDGPLVTADVLAQLCEHAKGADVALLTSHVTDPHGYGRIVRGDDQTVTAIVEERDADSRQRLITEVNGGVYVFDRDALTGVIGALSADNAQGELYLTDAVSAVVSRGGSITAVTVPETITAGVNDQVQLADAASELRRRHLVRLMRDKGVTVIDPRATFVDVDVAVGTGTTLLPGTMLTGGTVIGAHATIGPNTHLVGCTVGEGAHVRSTTATGAVIGQNATVGPYAHLRDGTVLEADTKVGAFVETKNTRLGRGSKAPHLTYLGDADVGEAVNIACGVITVNYDGMVKSRTVIGDRAFIGCDTMLIAPVTVGAGAYTAAGSVITEDVPADALAIARARQVLKEGWAKTRRQAGDRRGSA
jgi:bifunctional UDP-N-acetylglucosamine pyrophosphorylase/glucosamine-1-phosphate N-acetyltransferase